MKTYTFKIRRDFTDERGFEHHNVLVAIHCPIEVFYDSLRLSKEFETMTDCYITKSDYVEIFSNVEKNSQTGEQETVFNYIEHNEEVILCSICDVFRSKDFADFMVKLSMVNKENYNEI